MLSVTPIVRRRGRRIAERNGNNFAADHYELLWCFEMRLEFVHLFLAEPFEVFFSEADDEESSGYHVVDLAVLIPKGTVQRKPFQLALVITDNGNFIVEGINAFYISSSQPSTVSSFSTRLIGNPFSLPKVISRMETSRDIEPMLSTT